MMMFPDKQNVSHIQTYILESRPASECCIRTRGSPPAPSPSWVVPPGGGDAGWGAGGGILGIAVLRHVTCTVESIVGHAYLNVGK